MSLINDVLCDLQERQPEHGGAAPLAGLQPVARARPRTGALAGALVPLVAITCITTAWSMWPQPSAPVLPLERSDALPPAPAPATGPELESRLATPAQFSRSLTLRAPVGPRPLPVADPRQALARTVVAPRSPAPTTTPREVPEQRADEHAVAPPEPESQASTVVITRRDVPSDAPAAAARRLARTLLERDAADDALAVLEAHAPRGADMLEHAAFIAAVLQRLGRHEEALRAYRELLAQQPDVGAWWMGAAISQEALGRGGDALEMYTRAASTSDLDPRLARYAGTRVAALSGAAR